MELIAPLRVIHDAVLQTHMVFPPERDRISWTRTCGEASAPLVSSTRSTLCDFLTIYQACSRLQEELDVSKLSFTIYLFWKRHLDLAVTYLHTRNGK
jgi:hypothetical protein